jgi:hypothetical protein
MDSLLVVFLPRMMPFVVVPELPFRVRLALRLFALSNPKFVVLLRAA